MKINQLMMYSKIIAGVLRCIRNKYTVWAELRFVNVEPVGTYRKHYAFLKS